MNDVIKDIFELLLIEDFKASSIFEADGAIVKIDSSLKPNQPNHVKLVQIPETNCMQIGERTISLCSNQCCALLHE